MTVTKSIRPDDSELRQVEKLIQLMPGASEAAALKHLLLRGMQLQKIDMAVQLFTRDRLTTGEIAERLEMSRLDVIHALQERRVKVLDISGEDFERDLSRSL